MGLWNFDIFAFIVLVIWNCLHTGWYNREFKTAEDDDGNVGKTIRLITQDQEPITRSVHLHCIREPTHAQTELFLDMCFPRTSVSAAVRI